MKQKAKKSKVIKQSVLNRQTKVFIVSSIAVLLVLLFVRGLWQVDITQVPLNYGGDGTWILAKQQILIEETGLGYSSSRLGFPFGHESYDFTTGSLLPVMWQKLWAFVTDNAILGVNLSYLSGFFLITWISEIVLIKLGVEDNTAIAVSVLYAFVPYHLFRGTNHLSLSFYVTIPIVTYYMLKLMDSQLKQVKKTDIFVWIILMVLSGMDGVYYAFIACVFFGIAIIYNIINKNEKRNIVGCLLSIIFIVVGFFIAMLPSLIYWKVNGTVGAVPRSPAEIATYALRIAQLILPIYNHRISFLANITRKYSTLGVVNENAYVALGIVLAVGYLALWLSVLKEKKKAFHKDWGKLVTLTICGTVYASAGSLIEIQAIYFSLIRCSNRISIFLAFFACFAVAILLQEYFERHNFTGKRRKFAYWVLLFVLCVGIYDQTPSVDTTVYEKRLEELSVFEEFVEEIESKYPDTVILQLPYAVYPEAGKINEMEDYSHAALFFYSDTIKGSYGGIKGRKSDLFIAHLTALDVAEMIENASEVGFDGIYIDRYGYETREVQQLEYQIYEILGEAPIVSEDERYVFFSLERYIRDNAITYDENVVNYLLCGVKNGDNMYHLEENGVDNWYWAQNNSELIITNHSEESVDLCLSGNVAFYSGIDGTVTIKGADCKEILERGDFSVKITVEPGENVISFTSPNKNVVIDSGIRTVCFQLINCELRLPEADKVE